MKPIIPEELEGEICLASMYENIGWNACRAEIIKNLKERGGGRIDKDNRTT